MSVMAFLHDPLFAIYASSALVTAVNGVLIVYHLKKMRSFRNETRSEIDEIKRWLAALEEGLTALEEKSKRKIVA
jgi:hypothetical protein